MSLQKTKYSEYIEENLEAGNKCTLRESKTVLYIEAKGDVEKIKVDGGIIPKGTDDLRCDYLLMNLNESISNFIELKDTDVKHACDQIHDTIVFFKNDQVLKKEVLDSNRLIGYIVSPRCDVPAIESEHRKKAWKKLYYESKKKLDIPSNHLFFVKCITKNPGKIQNRTNNNSNVILNYPKNPLTV